jgi:hypothetical protein
MKDAEMNSPCHCRRQDRFSKSPSAKFQETGYLSRHGRAVPPEDLSVPGAGTMKGMNADPGTFRNFLTRKDNYSKSPSVTIQDMSFPLRNREDEPQDSLSGSGTGTMKEMGHTFCCRHRRGSPRYKTANSYPFLFLKFCNLGNCPSTTVTAIIWVLLCAMSRTTVAQLVPFSVSYSFAAGANNSDLAANNTGMYSRAFTHFVKHPLNTNLRILFGYVLLSLL